MSATRSVSFYVKFYLSNIKIVEWLKTFIPIFIEKSEVGEAAVNINYYMLAPKDLAMCSIFLHAGGKTTQVFTGWRHNRRIALASNSNNNICTYESCL
jgi:hypothetical protein